MAHVCDVTAEASTVESVPIVYEFLDVFPTALPRLPPGKGVDLAIKVESRTKPISMPLYRMAPAEHKELNV